MAKTLNALTFTIGWVGMLVGGTALLGGDSATWAMWTFVGGVLLAGAAIQPLAARLTQS